MKKGFTLLLLILLGHFAAAKNCAGNFYDINLEIRPAAHYLSADVHLTYRITQSGADSLRFLLHKNLIPKIVDAEGMAGYAFDTTSAPFFPFVPEAGTLILRFSKPLEKGKLLHLHFRYSGEIGIVSQWETNRITRNWVELGLYAPWFPFHPGMNDLTYSIRLNTDPGYMVFGPGDVHGEKGNWSLINRRPTSDIIVLAAPGDSVHSKIVDKDGLRIFCVSGLADSTLSDMADNGVWLLKTYRNWFGKLDNENVELALVPRKIGGGYARKGFIVFNKFTDSDYAKSYTGYFRFMAHEFSHLWWSNAPTDSWEDWLNEAFAEYTALRAVNERLGQKAFKALYNAKAREVSELPPIMGIDRSDKKAHDVLYDKGCILLTRLEQGIGREKMDRVLEELTLRKTASTQEFLMILAKYAGEDTANAFKAQLAH